ncbi:DDE-type integrase/transposase/recombinase [Pseudomonas sp.]|uniref:DDE-type integrase/transposase/recombinase n=1 Tax=Pseudomonas sp. TaxID=306 RepID=UPI002617E5F7|nr:DDE-type integrase/transposase/recombinase [Pseudomonas sp.]
MDEAEKLNLESIGQFVAASEEIGFEAEDRQQRYSWVEGVLVGQQYAQQGKVARGLLRRYIVKMTGLSRAQVTRLIARYTASGRVHVTVYRRRRFSQLYTRADIELLASVDEAHETLSGPATRRILEREQLLSKRPEYARLAGISVAHLYNLRKSQRYREPLLNYTRTRPTAVSIGERRKPQPEGQPGYLRLDTVHQGDGPEGKGVYHIDAVDEVTQWQVVGATPRISEAYLLPVLEDMMRQFPFRILGFHTDNGSEFINKTVAQLLEKLRVEQTKSRPRQSGDNGLVETKNGAVIRKHIGYGYIDASHAEAIDSFYCAYLNPYLNYHRPCAQADVKIDEKGRKRIRYKRYQTPLETLSLLDKPAQYLRDGLSMNALKRVAAAISDTDAARRMQEAKNKLFEKLRLTA